MKSKLLLWCLSMLTLIWGSGMAQAGIIRSTAKGVSKGSVAVVKGTPGAAADAADGVATAGKATGSAVASGASTAGKATGSAVATGASAAGNGVVQVPGLVARGTAGAAKAVWKAVW